MAYKRAAGVFPVKKTSLFVWTVSILEIIRIIKISACVDFGTCLKRRAPKNHEFWRYLDLQISYGRPIGGQNDELYLALADPFYI